MVELLQIWSGDLRGILIIVMVMVLMVMAYVSLNLGLLVNELDRIKLSRMTPTYPGSGALADDDVVVMVLQLGTELLWSDDLVDVVAWLMVNNIVLMVLVEDTSAEELDMLHLHHLVLKGQRPVPGLVVLG